MNREMRVMNHEMFDTSHETRDAKDNKGKKRGKETKSIGGDDHI